MNEVMTHGAKFTDKKVHYNIEDTSFFDIPLDTTKENFCKYDGKLIPLNDAVTVLRTDTNEVIGRPRSDKYKVINPKILFDRHAEKLLKSNLPTKNLEVTDWSFDNGAKSLRTTKFNDLDFQIGGGDTVKARQDIFTSLDLSWRFQVFNGGYRSLCENTCVFGGEKLYHQKKKHTKGISVESILTKLDKSLEQFYNNKDEMLKWRDSKVSDEQVAKLFADTVCKKPLADLKKKADPNFIAINQKLFDYLMYRYWEEVGSLGKNLWAVYNALTHWSTHTDAEWERENDKGVLVLLKTSRGTSNPNLVATRRQDAVREVLSSDEWKKLYKTN
tara:strand:- start:209 stop:1198 length:990 start_codon:yes stop_codon:yes gene_type:complete